MKICLQCQQHNPESARYCLKCGTVVQADTTVEQDAPVAQAEAVDLWRAFLGDGKTIRFSLKKGWAWESAQDRYLEQFQKFSAGGTPRFALTWHWPAFLFDPFLWFLYRKMYLYAAIYALGPVLSAAVTGDLTVGIVWRIMAGASANYIYYWHIHDHLRRIKAQSSAAPQSQEALIHDAGGVQSYVLWLGIVLHIFLLVMLIEFARDGLPEGAPLSPDKSTTAPGRGYY